MPRSIYIAEIRISAPIERKIKVKHNVTPEKVREALVLRTDITAGWENHEQHGRRVVALGHTAVQRPILAALYPVDPSDGVWNLMTARSPGS
ncbi:hypothetical protein [Symbioplanes lichenis]|uniref:hypothetical protein n=1 Tax=Symbioplanes lichenis TaxID=1629072 RepID=UPI002738E842|nr:hypothetical protein [Actinoplanes lichenis]